MTEGAGKNEAKLEQHHNEVLRLQLAAQNDANIAQTTLAAIVQGSDDAIISKTLQGIVVSWNRGAERLFGYIEQEMIGKSITTIIPPERRSEEEDILRRLVRGERIDHFETVRVTKHGRPVNVSITISPIRDVDGKIVGASKIARDITLQKHFEQERESLLASERAARSAAERANRLKDEFLAIVSHELRTPLNAILGWAQVLQQSPDGEDVKHGLEVIEKNTRLQAQLIEDLLDMSRILSGKLRLDIRRVDVAALVDNALEVVSPAARAKGIRLTKIIDPNAGPVSADATRLQQCIWNLLSNAVKFTPADGAVKLTLEQVNSHIEITVADNGVGIATEFLPFVFDRFQQAESSTTRKFGGLGLGLSIVRNLIELHGGSVRVSSAGTGYGATFVIVLPLRAVHQDTGDEPGEHPHADLGSSLSDVPSLEGVSVLVVDDEEDARGLIRRILEGHGARVETAGSAQEGLEMLQSSRPTVLISDIGMPGEDGYSFLRNVRGLQSDRAGRTPAIALTAFARSEDRQRILRAGFQLHMSKPIETVELVLGVANLAGKFQG